MFDELSRDVSTPEKLVRYVVSEGCADRLPGIDVDYAARMIKGITHLDAKVPTWWRTDHVHPIDLDILDISDGHCCVSAQLSGERDVLAFVKGRAMLLMTPQQYTAFGFNAEVLPDLADALGLSAEEAGEIEYNDDEAFALLTCLWRNVIRVRRGEPVSLRD